MGYFHFENEDKNDNAKMPATKKTRAQRLKENWEFNQLLLDVGLTSLVQTSFQSEVIEFTGEQGMAQLSKFQYNRLPLEEQKLRENVNPGRPSAVIDLKSALILGMSEEDVVNSTLEELVERGVKILAVCFSMIALTEVVGGRTATFSELATRDVGTKPTIHRGGMVVVFTPDTDFLLGLVVDEDAEARLATLRTDATDRALGNVFISISNPTSKDCLAKYSSLTSAATGTGISSNTIKDNVNAGTLDKLSKKVGVIIQRLEGRSEYEALVPIENGTKEMKSIMARNLKASPKSNPELKTKLEKHFAIWGEKAKDQTAFLNGIEAQYGYPVKKAKVLFRDWHRAKGEKTKSAGDIKKFFSFTTK